MPWTCLATHALTGVLIENVAQWAGGSRWDVANALALVDVEVSVRATILSLRSMLTHTLTGFHVKVLSWATHIC